MCKVFRPAHAGTGQAAVGAVHSTTARPAQLFGLPLLIAAIALLATLAGCVKEPQPRGVVLRELDSGYTSSNGGGQNYLGNQVNVGVTTRVP